MMETKTKEIPRPEQPDIVRQREFEAEQVRQGRIILDTPSRKFILAATAIGGIILLAIIVFAVL